MQFNERNFFLSSLHPAAKLQHELFGVGWSDTVLAGYAGADGTGEWGWYKRFALVLSACMYIEGE